MGWTSGSPQGYAAMRGTKNSREDTPTTFEYAIW
jgi:hypothetical protein